MEDQKISELTTLPFMQGTDVIPFTRQGAVESNNVQYQDFMGDIRVQVQTSQLLASLNFQTNTFSEGSFNFIAGENVRPLGGNGSRSFYVGTDIATENPINTPADPDPYFDIKGCDNGFMGTQIALGLTDGYRNYAYGSYCLKDLTSGHANLAFGYRPLTSVTTGSNNLGFGDGSFFHVTDSFNCTGFGVETGLSCGNRSNLGDPPIRDVSCFGYHAGYGDAVNLGENGLSIGSFSSCFGSNSARQLRAGSTHENLTAMGAYAGYSGGANSLYVGFMAGRRSVADNEFYLDALDRSSNFNEQTKSLMWGSFNADEALQKLQFNAQVTFPISTYHPNGRRALFGDQGAYIEYNANGFEIDSGNNPIYVNDELRMKSAINVIPDSGNAKTAVKAPGTAGEFYMLQDTGGLCYLWNVSPTDVFVGVGNDKKCTFRTTYCRFEYHVYQRAAPPATTPAFDGEMVMELTNDTTLTIKVRGNDGVTRSVALTLA